MQSLSEGAVELLNHFPYKNSISYTTNPLLIVEGRQKKYLAQKMKEFGSYMLLY